MSQYTSKDGQFYKVTNKTSGEFITAGGWKKALSLPQHISLSLLIK